MAWPVRRQSAVLGSTGTVRSGHCSASASWVCTSPSSVRADVATLRPGRFVALSHKPDRQALRSRHKGVTLERRLCDRCLLPLRGTTHGSCGRFDDSTTSHSRSPRSVAGSVLRRRRSGFLDRATSTSGGSCSANARVRQSCGRSATRRSSGLLHAWSRSRRPRTPSARGDRSRPAASWPAVAGLTTVWADWRHHFVALSHKVHGREVRQCSRQSVHTPLDRTASPRLFEVIEIERDGALVAIEIGRVDRHSAHRARTPHAPGRRSRARAPERPAARHRPGTRRSPRATPRSRRHGEARCGSSSRARAAPAAASGSARPSSSASS